MVAKIPIIIISLFTFKLSEVDPKVCKIPVGTAVGDVVGVGVGDSTGNTYINNSFSRACISKLHSEYSLTTIAFDRNMLSKEKPE